jgi:hypothetical protein
VVPSEASVTDLNYETQVVEALETTDINNDSLRNKKSIFINLSSVFKVPLKSSLILKIRTICVPFTPAFEF